MQFHCASCQGVEKANECFFLKVVRCLGVPDIVSIPNGCILLCGGQVLFELTHTFWGLTCLCAFKFDVISNFIWFGCCKTRILNTSSSIT
jgi:hypothetical protein